MGENETSEVKAPTTAVTATAEKPVAKAESTKNKKKEKKPVAKLDVVPHLTGRLLHVEIGFGGVEFAVKGKKGKAEVFSLKGADAATVPAMAAMLASLLEGKIKMRVEYRMSGDSRTVSKIRAHN